MARTTNLLPQQVQKLNSDAQRVLIRAVSEFDTAAHWWTGMTPEIAELIRIEILDYLLKATDVTIRYRPTKA